MLTPRRLLWALLLSLAALSLNLVHSQEVATLYLPGRRIDEHFARVWVADAGPYIWVRANPTVVGWLEAAGEAPNVTLWRGEERAAWRARIWEREETAGYVDALFREKYGVTDWLRSQVQRTPLVPVRLERR
jgi:hypothetical protein